MQKIEAIANEWMRAGEEEVEQAHGDEDEAKRTYAASEAEDEEHNDSDAPNDDSSSYASSCSCRSGPFRSHTV